MFALRCCFFFNYCLCVFPEQPVWGQTFRWVRRPYWAWTLRLLGKGKLHVKFSHQMDLRLTWMWWRTMTEPSTFTTLHLSQENTSLPSASGDSTFPTAPSLYRWASLQPCPLPLHWVIKHHYSPTYFLCKQRLYNLLLILYTLHTTLYTLHFTPYTLHSTPYTLHRTCYTLHPTRYILYPTLNTLHPICYTLHPTLYTLHSTHYTLHTTLYTVKVYDILKNITLDFVYDSC